MKNSKQIFSTILLLSATAFLTACGATKAQEGTTNSSSVDTSSKPLSYCSQAANSDVSAKLKVYMDQSNNVRYDYVYVRLAAIPSNFQSGGSYISMWKWMANSSGSTYLDNTALNMMLVSNSGQALTDWKSSLRWSDIQTAASNQGYSDAAAFLNNVNVLVDLKDTNGEYDVLKISNYDASTNKATSQVDALLPMFYASPADYAFEANGAARASVLQSLHPFKDYINQGYTASQFKSMAVSLCY